MMEHKRTSQTKVIGVVGKPNTGKSTFFCATTLAPPKIAFECRSTRLRLETVAQSELVDWTSRLFVEQSSLAPAVTILPVKDLFWVRPIGLIYRQESYQAPAVKRLIEVLRTAAKVMKCEPAR